jgi:hypothetical protein
MIETEKLEEEEKQSDAAFNASIPTLDRISQIISDIHGYKASNNVYGFKVNLELLVIEAQGFLDKKDAEKLWRDWKVISAFAIVIDKRERKQKYDQELLRLMNDLYVWVRLKLHQKHVTMAAKMDHLTGMAKLDQRYHYGRR